MAAPQAQVAGRPGCLRDTRCYFGLDTSFAKFFSKVAMLSIFPFREISCES